MKMNRQSGLFAAMTIGLATLVAAPAQADFLSLRDGTVLEGVFEGANAVNFRFRVDGIVQRVPASEVKSLELSPRPEAEALSMKQPAEKPKYLIVGSGPGQYIEARITPTGSIGPIRPIGAGAAPGTTAIN